MALVAEFAGDRGSAAFAETLCDALGAETVEARASWAFISQAIWGIHRNVIKR